MLLRYADHQPLLSSRITYYLCIEGLQIDLEVENVCVNGGGVREVPFRGLKLFQPLPHLT